MPPHGKEVTCCLSCYWPPSPESCISKESCIYPLLTKSSANNFYLDQQPYFLFIYGSFLIMNEGEMCQSWNCTRVGLSLEFHHRTPKIVALFAAEWYLFSREKSYFEYIAYIAHKRKRIQKPFWFSVSQFLRSMVEIWGFLHLCSGPTFHIFGRDNKCGLTRW